MRDVDGVLRRASRTFSPHRVDEVYVNVSTALFIEAEGLRFGVLGFFRVLEGYSGGGLEGIKCECRSDGLLECFQGSAVGRVEDSPGLDVSDGALDHLADPVDAPVLLLGRLA